MKTIFISAGIVLLSVTFIAAKPETVYSNQHNVKAVNSPFTYFRAHRMASDASLNWGISNPLEVRTFTIKYSYDNDYWMDVDGVEIMCNGNATFRHRLSAFPGTTYYKIVAEMNDNSVVESAVESVRIVKRG
jgi:hypothetical protein